MKTDHLTSATLLIVVGIAAIVYWPVLHLGYVWDDWQLFINNPSLRLPDTVWQALVQPILSGTTYFRPVVLGSFALEFAACGVNPALSHGINLILHCGNTVLVALIALRLTNHAALSSQAWRVLLAGLLYGLHPALIESVTWVAGRFDLMATFFVLLGVWGYLALKGWRRDVLVTVAFLLAALSKEMAATMPMLLLLFYIGLRGRDFQWKDLMRDGLRSGEWRLYVLLGFAGLTVLVMRQVFLGALSHEDLVVSEKVADLFHHLAFIGHTLLFYLRMSLWPVSDLNPQHPFDPAAMDVMSRWIGVMILLTVAVALAFLLKSRRWPALLLTGWAVALLPVLNIIPLTTGGNIGHERFLVLPLAFLVLSAATISLPQVSLAMRRALPAFASGLVAFLAMVAVTNIRVTLPLWQNDLTLWAWAYAKHPNFPFVQASYAGAAVRYHDYERVETVINSAGEPLNYVMKAIKALYLNRIGRPAESLKLYQEVLAELPLLPHEILFAKGISLDDVVIKKMNAMQWFYQSTYTGLAETHLALRNFQASFENARIALFYAPRYPSAWMAKAFALYGLDRWAEGEEAFAQAILFFLPEGKIDAQRLRSQFLTQLCDEPSALSEVCRYWKNENATPRKQF